MTLKRKEQDDSVVSLWARLPEELIEAILAHLPVPSLIRAGTVCKRWRTLLNSAGFKLKCSQTPAHRPWLMAVGRNNECRGYSPSDDVWYDLPRQTLVGFGLVVASASGLLCMEGRYDRSVLVIVDPMSKDVRELPKLEFTPIDHSVALHVLENSCPVVYRVVVFACGEAADGECAMFTSIFDSDVGSWRESLSEIPFPPSQVLDHGVAGSIVYCRVVSTLGGCRVVAYDVCADSWMEVRTNGLPCLKRCILVGCQGEVMLVSYGESISEQKDRKRRGLPTGNIKVFLLDILTREWRELDQLEHIPASKDKKDMFSIVGGSKGEFYLHSVRRHRNRWRHAIMRYDHSSRIWTSVVPNGHRSTGYEAKQFVCYQPRWGLCMNTSQPYQ